MDPEAIPKVTKRPFLRWLYCLPKIHIKKISIIWSILCMLIINNENIFIKIRHKKNFSSKKY